MQIAADAKTAIAALNEAGFEAYVVGGSVRDHLMGRPQYDTDITTSAFPEEVTEVLGKAGFRIFQTGAAHGTVTAVARSLSEETDTDSRHELEVTTFRVDGAYLDNRHPSEVTFTRSLTEDLARRDFTINAMAYSDETGIVDPYGGQEDLAAGVIRCVGDPDRRFSEDALRIMRALRFSAQLGFSIEPQTADSLRRNANLLSNISRERIAAELTRLLCGKNVHAVLIDYVDVLGVAIPELLPMVGFDQCNDAHVLDVWEHTVATVDNIPPRPILRYTALLHDCGKPATFSLDKDGVGHFKGHAGEGARIARGVLEGLHLPVATTERVCLLIADHVAMLDPDERCMRRWMARIGTDALRELIDLKRADVAAHDPSHHYHFRTFATMDEIIDRLVEQHACVKMSDLAIDGGDLIGMGYQQGPAIGVELASLLERVIDGDLENDHETLVELARAEKPSHDRD